jgi:hypothetical protein
MMTGSLKRFDPDIAAQRPMDLYASAHQGLRASVRSGSDAPASTRMAA